MARIGRPPKAERPPITPEEILDHAAGVFARSGFRGAPLADIARELGITRAALYIHFDSKQAILQALVVRLFARFEHATDAAAADRDAPPRERLRALLAGHAAVVTENLALVDVIAGEEAELRAIADDVIAARVDAYWQRFRDAYRACIDAGEARDVDPNAATHSMIGAVNGLRHWYDPAGTTSGPAAVAFAADFAIDGIRPGPPEPAR